MTSAAMTRLAEMQLRKRPRAEMPEQLSKSEMLRAAREELRALQEERKRHQEREAETLLRQRDETLQRLEDRLI